MKVMLRRSQPNDGKFVVVFKLVLSDEEIALVKKYRQQTALLGHIDSVWSGEAVSGFYNTCGFETDNAMVALAVERQVMADLQKLQDYLDVAVSYTGDSEFVAEVKRVFGQSND